MADMVTLDFDAIFDQFIAANQKVWAHDRSTTLGASEVFSCIRKAWFDKRGKEHGYEPDVDYVEDWGALTRGNLIENHHVVPAIKDHMPDNTVVLFTGDDQKTLAIKRASATPDGLITGLPKNGKVRIKAGRQDFTIDNIESDCIVLEIKSIDPRATLNEERRKHNGQTHMQLGLFNELTEHKPVYSIVLYIDASFLSNVTPFIVKFDPEVYATGKMRSEIPWQCEDPAELTPEGVFDNDCEYCKWRGACGAASVSAIPRHKDSEADVTDETREKMGGLVSAFDKAKKDYTEAEKQVELAREAIKGFLMTTNRRKISSDDWTVTWYSQKGKTTYSTKAMLEDGMDLTKYEKVGSEFDTLRVMPKAKTKKDKK